MMPDVMNILGWKAEGFRCPDHEINCCDQDGNPSSISLIQMPNGTGKTTTLLLLRAALSGDASNWSSENIREMKKKGSERSNGVFILRLRLNSQLFTIIMEFNFENSQVTYKTTGPSGQDVGFNPPRSFRKFMKPDFVNYYVFDGELAQHLLEKSQSDAIIVIERLFPFNILNYLSNKIHEYWESNTRSSTAKDERGYTRRLNRVVNLTRILSRLEKAQSNLRKNKDQLDAEISEKGQKYDEEILRFEGHSGLIEHTQTKLKEYVNTVKQLTKECLNIMADPHALSVSFANAIHTFKISLDKVKLPESAAKEFFDELAEEDCCVCGREIDEEIRNTIKERAKQYLGSEEFALLNSMKTVIVDAVGTSRDIPEKELQEKLKNLANWVRLRELANNELNELQDEAERQDPKIAEAKTAIDKLVTDFAAIESQLKQFEDGIDRGDDRTTDIKLMQAKKNQAEDDLSEITNTLALKVKRDIIQDILVHATEMAKDTTIAEICTLANSRIEELMPYNSIRIDTIDSSLVLEGQTGGSAGEQLSIAYAFLASLFNSSDQQLPFVVDSPAGPIDLAIRPRIAELIPKLSNQFIAFTISSEREGFVPRLASSCKDSIKYFTLFRKGISEIEIAAQAMDMCQVTNDGLIVEDENFFNSFQIETEEE